MRVKLCHTVPFQTATHECVHCIHVLSHVHTHTRVPRFIPGRRLFAVLFVCVEFSVDFDQTCLQDFSTCLAACVTYVYAENRQSVGTSKQPDTKSPNEISQSCACSSDDTHTHTHTHTPRPPPAPANNNNNSNNKPKMLMTLMFFSLNKPSASVSN